MKPVQMKTQIKTDPDTAQPENRLIDSAAELSEICSKIAANGRVAVDTEFVWERTYYPNLGIVQLALNEKEAWLLDMPALKNQLEPLAEVLANPEIEKILHDAKQDLTILRIATGAKPKNIFDTRLAAGFIGEPATLSLLDSCAMFADLTLEKGETRSNWLKRPLTDKQLQYAIDDVLFLPLIRDQIMIRAEALNHDKWIKDEMKSYDNSELYDDPPIDQVYSKVKGTGRLSRKELAILLELAAWREQEARYRNRPRRHIIPDEPLLEMAHHQPADIDQLKQNCSLSPRAYQRYAKKLLTVINKGLQTPETDYPESLKRPRNQKVIDLSRKILDFITELGQNNDLDPTLISTRKEVEKFLLSGNRTANNTTPLMQGWRFELAGEKIIQMLQNS